MLFTIKVETSENYTNNYSFYVNDENDLFSFVYDKENKYISSSYSIDNKNCVFNNKLITFLPDDSIVEAANVDRVKEFSFRELCSHITACLKCNIFSYKDILNKNITLQIDDLKFIDVIDDSLIYDDIWEDIYSEPYEELNTLNRCYDVLDEFIDVIDDGVEKIFSNLGKISHIFYCNEILQDLGTELNYQKYITEELAKELNKIITRYHYEV